MIVWITHAKVGHRQTPIKQKAQPCVGLSALWDLICDLLEFTTTRAKGTCCGGDSYRLHRCDVETKVGHRQTPYQQQSPPREGFVVSIMQPQGITLTKQWAFPIMPAAIDVSI